MVGEPGVIFGEPVSVVRLNASASLHQAAHDIRTPLTTVMQGIDALLELTDDTSDRAQRIFDALRRNVQWMGEVLDASVARRPRPRQEVDLVALVEDTQALVEPLLRARRQTIAIEAMSQLPRIRGDHGSLARAVLNLIDNASKYGPRGDRLRVTVRKRAAGIVVSVIDHGPGIPPGERHAIFRAFYRTATARSSGRDGVGLGLAVVRDVVRAHGGRVGVSRSNGATRVWFFLPAQPYVVSQRA
jgi:signal transduction histidine kinase